MGNIASAGGAGGGKIVLPDGSIRALGEPVSVAELMVEHPCHFVVDARLVSTTAGSAKVAALPADDVLDGAGVYVLLPATRGRVSVDEARRALAASRTLPLSRSTRSGAREQQDEATAVRGSGLGDYQPEFLSQELKRGPWKPSLKTIEERSLPRKVPHWLFRNQKY